MNILPFVRRCLAGSPIWLQNIYYTGHGVRKHFAELGPLFREYLAVLKDSQWWDADRIRAHQDAQVRWLAAHAYENVPFYREWFDAAGVHPRDIQTQNDLARLPLLTKQIVRDRQRKMVVRRPAGAPVLRRGTSGTTGTAIEIQEPYPCRCLHRAVIYRGRARFGITPRDRRLRFTAQTGLLGPRSKPPYWWRDLAGNSTSVSPVHLTRDSVPLIARWLCEEHFDYTTGWPTPLLLLANHIREHGMALRKPLKLIEWTSETLMESNRRRLQEIFNAPARGFYDMTEFAGNLSMCEHERYHLDFETCCLQTEPVPGGSGVCRLIWTGWGNPHMPFIRYDVGDHATPLNGPCPCGRQSPTFASIDGRIEDFIRTPDGRIAFGLNVHLPSAREVQVVQRRLEEIEVQVVPGPDYDPSQEAEMLRRLRERVGEVIGIRLEKVDSIPRTPSGKFRAVVSELARES